MKGNCNKCIIASTFKNICEKCNKDKNKRNNKMKIKSGDGILSEIDKTKYYSKITAKDVADDLTEFFKSEEMKCKDNNENYIDKRCK